MNASAIGFYGDRGDEMLDESSSPGDGFLADVCRAWEGATQAAEEAGARVCFLRTGMVLDRGEGVLGRMVPIFNLGAGGKLGSGKQWMPWISLADEIGAIRYAMDHDLSGPINLTGPNPVRNEEFTPVLAAVLGRPALLPVPAFGLRAVLGEFSADVLSSTRVRPEVLISSGYVHQHTDVESALRWALDQ